MRNLSLNKLLWLVLGLMTLAAAVTGVLKQDIYSKVVNDIAMAGTISQDLIAILAGIMLLGLAASVRERDLVKQIIALGLVGFLFYGYGLYVMERTYNMLYLLYMAIFSISFYAMIHGIASISRELVQKIQISSRMRWASIIYTLGIVIMFSAIWVNMLLPLMQTGEKPDTFYAIFIIDLAFIMPAFAILAVMSVRKQGLSLILLPAMYVLGITLLVPVGLGEFLKPYYGHAIDWAGAQLYLGVSASFLMMVVLHLRSLRVGGSSPIRA